MRNYFFLLIAFLLFIAACKPTQKESPQQSPETERQEILALVKDFSASLVAGDYDAIADAYTADGKIFPGNRDIIAGREAIHTYWLPDSGSAITAHQIFPEEIVIQDTTAYDYGYYEVSGKSGENTWGPFRGKYVIVWKKVSTDGWKIHLDIWNRAVQKE